MKKRVIHKTAMRDTSRYSGHSWNGLTGIQPAQLCREYAPYMAKNPILSLRWEEVTCKHCISGKYNGVPDGMDKLKNRLRLIKTEEAANA